MISLAYLFEGVNRDKRIEIGINAKENPTYPKKIARRRLHREYGKGGDANKYFADLAKKHGKDSKKYKNAAQFQRQNSKWMSKAEQGLINR